MPREDNDQKLYWYDDQGESIYTNPPDPNMPSIDHGVEEDSIWAFNLTAYNQWSIKNPYLTDTINAAKQSHAPFWGTKLAMPAFFRREK